MKMFLLVTLVPLFTFAESKECNVQIGFVLTTVHESCSDVDVEKAKNQLASGLKKKGYKIVDPSKGERPNLYILPTINESCIRHSLWNNEALYNGVSVSLDLKNETGDSILSTDPQLSPSSLMGGGSLRKAMARAIAKIPSCRHL